MRSDAEGLVRELARRCPRIGWRILDPELSPELARKHAIARGRTTVFMSGSRVVKTRGCNEVHLHMGIRRLLRTAARRVLFLHGHGERPKRLEQKSVIREKPNQRSRLNDGKPRREEATALFDPEQARAVGASPSGHGAWQSGIWLANLQASGTS